MKEMLSITFRYYDTLQDNSDTCYREKTITIGIYDSIEKAVDEGNKLLNQISNTFEIRKDDAFKVKGLFGKPTRLVSNCAYPTNLISYYAKITQLDFSDVLSTIKDIENAYLRYVNFKVLENNIAICPICNNEMETQLICENCGERKSI